MFTQALGCRWPGCGLVLPALAVTGCWRCSPTPTAGCARVLRVAPVVLTLLFLALLRGSRAEGLTRVTRPIWAGCSGSASARRSRHCAELGGWPGSARRGAAVRARRRDAAARPDAIGYLMITATCAPTSAPATCGKPCRRLHMAARATPRPGSPTPTGNPAMVVTAAPSSSLAGEIERLLPQLRATVGAHRSATLNFDRGGWSPTLLKKIVDASST